MLEEGYTWSQERQDRWEKLREKGCWNYVLKMTLLAFVSAVLIAIVYWAVALASGRDFRLSTVLMIPVLGILSGLIVGRSYWGLCESIFQKNS